MSGGPERDPKTGRFLPKGRTRGKGGARAVDERPLPDLVAAMRAQVSQEDWQAVIKVVLEKAKEGDEKARVWLADYLLGKPTARTDVANAAGAMGEKGNAPDPPEPVTITLKWEDD